MKFIEGTHRHQTYFATLDDQVSADNAVRLMDAFIDKLDLTRLEFTNTVHKSEGRPPYQQQLTTHIIHFDKFITELQINRFRPTSVSFLARWAKRNLSY